MITMTANRSRCITQKIESAHGSHYVHVSFADGKITGVSISSPGKFANTAIGALLVAISEATAQIIADIGRGDA